MRMRDGCVHYRTDRRERDHARSAAVESAHERSLDRNEYAIRHAHIGFDPPNMMRVGPWKNSGVS